mmetsp:Transcript_33525/g.57477  ORF Transcript_33525/g.57477 Transcript_33525/m.57477 type:complete len:203 (+) Transcript_33525:72-680(+)
MGNACSSPDAVRSFNSLEVDDGGLPPILPKLRRQELSDEGRNLLVDAMQGDSRSGSKSSAAEATHQQPDPHIKILVIDEVHRRHVAAFDTRETPSLAGIKEELARIRESHPTSRRSWLQTENLPRRSTTSFSRVSFERAKIYSYIMLRIMPRRRAYASAQQPGRRPKGGRRSCCSITASTQAITFSTLSTPVGPGTAGRTKR